MVQRCMKCTIGSLSPMKQEYQLFLAGTAVGTLGESMINEGYFTTGLSGMSFSTPDRDNDRNNGGNFAPYSNRRGGWWLNDLYYAVLKGKWSPADWHDPWYPTVWRGTTVKETMMLIRRH
ncbi:fibrinogen gamma chain-like [Saccostrea echinata]|uniref:fibrinogen gamma chain-like n=1 Tax=Saccostrea echinata TaxID=191078 RepID=UPI002A82FFFC|nr:fibrinogen gamma chain-like [Saccostrea echinata]